MLMYKRYPQLLTIEQRELWVGVEDSSVLVLKDHEGAITPIVESNLEGTRLWGMVESVVSVDRLAMLDLAKSVCGPDVGVEDV